MDSLLKTWENLTLQRRVLLGMAVIGSLLLVLMLGRIAATPSMSLLYGGLDQKNAGEVIAALDQMGVRNEVRGDSIYVPSSDRDRVRLSLAQQGLPGQGQAGYELLDNLSGFGTTSEMFQAAYWRAKEGELARTIHAVSGVRKARVHIGAGARRPFTQGASKATATVTVRTTGAGLSDRSALAIRFLVALAVPNLDPTDVAVIDAERGVVLKPGAETSLVAGVELGEQRAQALRAKLEELLSVRVGDGNVRVNVTVETTDETKTISERIVDPESQVPVTSETEEVSDNSTGGAGAVTVASNLPEGDGAAAGGAKSQRTETREKVDYKYSETRRDQRIEAGAIKRLGVAVLVNEVATTAEDGTVTFAPRPPEELSAIEELVKSTVVFDSERGDVVTVESMRFALLPETGGAVVEEGFIDRILREQGGSLLQILALGLVTLLLGMFVLRPILAQQSADDAKAEDAIAELDAIRAGGEAAEALDADSAAQQILEAQTPALQTATIDANAAMAQNGESAAEGSGELVAANTQTPAPQSDAQSDAAELFSEIDEDDPRGLTLGERFKEAVENRPSEVVTLLRFWLNNGAEDDEGASA